MEGIVSGYVGVYEIFKLKSLYNGMHALIVLLLSVVDAFVFPCWSSSTLSPSSSTPSGVI